MRAKVLREEEIKMAHAEAEKNEVLDYLSPWSSYFPCGFSREPYYNYEIAEIIAMIGKTHKEKGKANNSNYHEGIAYIASKFKISKRKVKLLRKKIKTLGGYQFKTPYEIAVIVGFIIDEIKSNDSNKRWDEFFDKNEGRLYRDILIKKQKDAIDISLMAVDCKRIRDVKRDLDSLIEMCGK